MHARVFSVAPVFQIHESSEVSPLELFALSQAPRKFCSGGGVKAVSMEMPSWLLTYTTQNLLTGFRSSGLTFLCPPAEASQGSPAKTQI